ncbi:hypothetical protein WCN91_08550 [Pseudoalteromonas sp. YIC-827]|uniref:Uncharacterized protein n=1 Tax=Pseudoalteromonas qingdaonensis TaxID=3131913 RepID=A0ABU9MW07_9GAMM
MRTAKFSHALFVSIVWISLVPMLLVVLFLVISSIKTPWLKRSKL